MPNGVLLRVGLIQERIGWLNDVYHALVGVMVPTIWKTYPYHLLFKFYKRFIHNINLIL